MNLDFGEYEPWMKDQVVSMFCEQYGNETGQFSAYFDRFYGTYQAGKALRIVVLDGDTVAGFVSFSYWPYKLNGKTFNSYQCGNVIINKNYRGQGLYNRMLDHVNKLAPERNIDFIVGFPIKEILKLYLKSQWKNPMNLNWYVSVINPLGMLFTLNDRKLSQYFRTEKKHVNANSIEGLLSLDVDESFYRWNKHYNNLSGHYFFSFQEGGNFVEFTLKLNRRKYLNELIVGEINTNSRDEQFLVRAFRKLKSKARRLLGISLLSFCMNDRATRNPVTAAMRSAGFKKIERDIKFIVKNFRANEEIITDPANWVLYRRDIDTW